MTLKIEVGQKWRSLKTSEPFYTQGQEYEVLSVSKRGDTFTMTDNFGAQSNGGAGHGWTATPDLLSHFVPLSEQSKIEPGWKYDAGKARIDLIAPELLQGTAEILDFGAKKYGERNWEAGMSWSRPFAALMRHMWAWWAGERQDAETGKSHLYHAACCLMFLIAFEERTVGTDDRPKISK